MVTCIINSIAVFTATAGIEVVGQALPSLLSVPTSAEEIISQQVMPGPTTSAPSSNSIMMLDISML